MSTFLPSWFSPTLLSSTLRGIEKEGLRMQPDGYSAKTPHPSALGSKLTHPNITTDYSENLLELITKPCASIDEAFATLKTLHQVVVDAMDDDEIIWPLSMPCMLSDDDADIPLADYGTSNVGRLKTLYRAGLGVRYGRKMQTIAGLHYNLSFGNDLFQAWFKENSDGAFLDFKNDKYLALIRNFKRLTPMILYFFGASPSVCACFVKNKTHHLSPLTNANATYYAPYATSLRMGKLGYTNSVQDNLDIRYNRLDEYISALKSATKTPYTPFSKIGIDNKNGNPIQINDHILQIENEYYSVIRPKQVAKSGENPSQALQNRGIGYVEFRAIDLNPYVDVGIEKHSACFLEMCALYCLLSPSEALLPDEETLIAQNIERVVEFGRKNNTSIFATKFDDAIHRHQNGGEQNTILLKDYLSHHVQNLDAFAQAFDAAYGTTDYQNALAHMQSLAQNTDNTPSARIIADSKALQSTLKLGQKLGMMHKQSLKDAPLDADTKAHFDKLAKQSMKAQAALEDNDDVPFLQYLQAFRN